MKVDRVLRYGILVAALLTGSCAIPVAPTGGPQDETPPAIVEAVPPSESVNVNTETIRVVFSEYVNQASFAQALSVTPAFDTPLRFRWRKNRVDITFPEPLRENTTYILTIDTNLRDIHQVALDSPITLAFATGPSINRGRIEGRVVLAVDGAGLGNMDVYAYAVSDSIPARLPDRPDYRTQSTADGAFTFEYLSEQPYYVIALQDGNRNRVPDANERFATPPAPAIFADSVAIPVAVPWIVTRVDTVAPSLERVRALSRSRLQLRFSESIQLLSRAPEDWVLTDSSAGTRIEVNDIYMYEEDPRQLYLLTPPLSGSAHTLQPAHIADSSGNAVSPSPATFTPTRMDDTLQTRFVGFQTTRSRRGELGQVLLAPGENPAVRLNQPIPVDSLERHTTLQDTSSTIHPFSVSTENGAVFTIHPDPSFSSDLPFSITIQGDLANTPDTVYTETFAYLTASALGELSGVVATTDSSSRLVVELFPANGRQRTASTVAGEDGLFRFTGLPDQESYQLRAFLDENGNSAWDGGLLIPYEDAEPMTWYTDSLQVRARWEQAIPDTLRILQRSWERDTLLVR